jgi:hypothetical protein
MRYMEIIIVSLKLDMHASYLDRKQSWIGSPKIVAESRGHIVIFFQVKQDIVQWVTQFVAIE